MSAESGEKEGPLHAIDAARTLQRSLLKTVQRLLVFAEARIDVGEMVWRHKALACHLFELRENAQRLVASPGVSQGLPNRDR